jgi:hypothetical protein
MAALLLLLPLAIVIALAVRAHLRTSRLIDRLSALDVWDVDAEDTLRELDRIGLVDLRNPHPWDEIRSEWIARRNRETVALLRGYRP